MSMDLKVVERFLAIQKGIKSQNIRDTMLILLLNVVKNYHDN